MAETQVVESLSGAEIIEAVVVKIKEALQRDCYLSPTTAYQTFEADIDISIRMIDVGRYVSVVKDVDVTLPAGAKVPIIIGSPKSRESNPVRASVRIPPMPPNQLRVETGQGVPTLVEAADGKRRIEKVTYSPTKQEAEEDDGLPVI